METICATVENIPEIDPVHHLNLLFLLGMVVFGGTIGAKIFGKLKIPQVVGYIVIGLVIGEAGFRLIRREMIGALEPLSLFALGIIGFLIGGELKLDILRKYGKRFLSILLGEGLASFALVGISVTLLSYVFLDDIRIAVALGVVLGAIASATDPASTIQVLWEYKARGALTTAVIAVVALDDALALTLYGIGSSIAGALCGQGGESLWYSLGMACFEMGLALVLGAVSGGILYWILLRIQDPEGSLAFIVGAVLLVLGISAALKLDVILASMALGFTLINCAPRRSHRAFDMIKQFAPPIYVLFFVFVGARLSLRGMSLLAWLLVAVYVVGRGVGKIVGAYLGAKMTRSQIEVRKYLGMCLFAQGGVAIGLSILASHRFENGVSEIVVLVVASTTFIVQLLGPLAVKHGVQKSGEAGMNVTEEDLIETYNVGDVMEKDAVTIEPGLSLRELIELVSSSDENLFSVVDQEKKLLGIITLSGLRKTFASQELNDWLVAMDIMEPVILTVSPQTQLSKAMGQADRMVIESVPVLASQENQEYVGLLDVHSVKRSISAEVLRRQRNADSM